MGVGNGAFLGCWQEYQLGSFLSFGSESWLFLLLHVPPRNSEAWGEVAEGYKEWPELVRP